MLIFILEVIFYSDPTFGVVLQMNSIGVLSYPRLIRKAFLIIITKHFIIIIIFLYILPI